MLEKKVVYGSSDEFEKSMLKFGFSREKTKFHGRPRRLLYLLKASDPRWECSPTHEADCFPVLHSEAF